MLDFAMNLSFATARVFGRRSPSMSGEAAASIGGILSNIKFFLNTAHVQDRQAIENHPTNNT